MVWEAHVSGKHGEIGAKQRKGWALPDLDPQTHIHYKMEFRRDPISMQKTPPLKGSTASPNWAP